MKTITIQGNKFIIKIPYDINLVNLIKTSFSQRSWNPEIKSWVAVINEKNISTTYYLQEKYDFIISPETSTQIEEYKEKLSIHKKQANEIIELSKAIEADIEIPTTLKGELFPYQKAGVQFIEKTGGKTLISDSMGLGKTVQSIAWSLLHTEKRPILVICPSTLKINWKREFEKWSNIKSYIIDSKDNSYLLPTSEAYIINYDIVEKKKELLQKLDIKIVILDEAHYTKNPKAQRTKAINELVKNIPHILALTGTPILNRPIEMYNVLKMLDSKNFGNYWNFVSRYCGMQRTRWGMDVTGATNIEELSNLLRSTVMIRREKKDVLKELPDKMRVVVPQEVDLKEYKKIEDDLIQYLVENKNKSKLQAEKISQVEQLAKIEYCKQEAVKAKLPLFIEWVKDFMEVNGKLVIFAHHVEFVEKLMQELKEYSPVKIIGGMEGEAKQKSIDIFMQDKNCKLIICSIKAAGVGITLTESSHVAFLELGWTPADHDQAEDRCHRIGQKDNVSCYYFLAQNTIEEVIYNLIQEKRKIFTQLMQDTNIISEEKTSILTDLINNLVN